MQFGKIILNKSYFGTVTIELILSLFFNLTFLFLRWPNISSKSRNWKLWIAHMSARVYKIQYERISERNWRLVIHETACLTAREFFWSMWQRLWKRSTMHLPGKTVFWIHAYLQSSGSADFPQKALSCSDMLPRLWWRGNGSVALNNPKETSRLYRCTCWVLFEKGSSLGIQKSRSPQNFQDCLFHHFLRHQVNQSTCGEPQTTVTCLY